MTPDSAHMPPRAPPIIIHLRDVVHRMLEIIDQHAAGHVHAAVMWAHVERAMLELARLADAPERALHEASSEPGGSSS